MPDSTQTQKADGWTKFAVFQLYGSYYVGKIFALVGGPLVALLLFHRSLCHTIYRALTRRDPLSFVCWTLLISIMYGIFGVVYGILSGYDVITALQILVFNLCPIYFFLGIWAGARRPGFLQGFIKFSLWYTVVYTFLYFLVLRNVSNDDSIGHPGSGLITFLAPFCFEFPISIYWLPILVGTFNLIAAQIRADWAGLAIALVIWGATAKKLGRVFSIAGVVLGLLIVGFVFDVRVPGFSDRGGEISARDTVGRALSSFDPEMAREYSSGADVYAGTVHWRETWWREIRETVTQSPTTIVFGMGYGYPIGDLVSYLKGMDIRTPHSIFYFTLCYSGIIGVAIFFTLQAGILLLHWRTFKATGQIYGFVTHIALLTSAFFGNLFEAPQAAIPLYLIFGMSVGPLFDQRYTDQETTDSEHLLEEPVQEPRRIRMRGYAPLPNPASD
jgi:hypothetical protein